VFRSSVVLFARTADPRSIRRSALRALRGGAGVGALALIFLLAACGGPNEGPGGGAVVNPAGVTMAEAGPVAVDVRTTDTFTLDASASTSAAGVLTYAWRQIRAGEALQESTDVDPTFDAGDEVTTLIFRLTITDERGATSTDDIQIDVLEDPGFALFVDQANGVDTNMGTRADPFATVGAAVAMANSQAFTYDIYLKSPIDGAGACDPAGFYDETGGKLTAEQGVSVYGGFDADWRRDTTNCRTEIRGELETLEFIEIDEPTTVSGLRIHTTNLGTIGTRDPAEFMMTGIRAIDGRDLLTIKDNVIEVDDWARLPGASVGPGVAGIFASGIRDLMVEDNQIIAGTPGDAPTRPAVAPGEDGQDGRRGFGSGSSGGVGSGGGVALAGSCNPAIDGDRCGSRGGFGGTARNATNNTGQGTIIAAGPRGAEVPVTPSRPGCVPAAGVTGIARTSSISGQIATPQAPNPSDDPGLNGAAGCRGIGAPVAMDGGTAGGFDVTRVPRSLSTSPSQSTLSFRGEDGEAGMDGTGGQGGAGGGATQWAVGNNSEPGFFGRAEGGGGGGEGGDGGRGGLGGRGGSASIAVALHDVDDATVRCNLLRTGDGGRGALGSDGSDGGLGGLSGSGSSGSFFGTIFYGGGNGGAGGDGADGSDGGAGGGAPAYALVAGGANAGAALFERNTLDVGQPGVSGDFRRIPAVRDEGFEGPNANLTTGRNVVFPASPNCP